MWDLGSPTGIELEPPAKKWEVLTTGPPGKSPEDNFNTTSGLLWWSSG